MILSHLHFDHAGGGISLEGDQLVTTFPRAEYVVQRLEWEIADGRLSRAARRLSAGEHRPARELGTAATGRWRRGNRRRESSAGSQADTRTGSRHCSSRARDKRPSTWPTPARRWRHLPSLWCMSYDMDLLQSRRIKPMLLGEIADRGWLALFDHDPDYRRRPPRPRSRPRIRRDRGDCRIVELSARQTLQNGACPLYCDVLFDCDFMRWHDVRREVAGSQSILRVRRRSNGVEAECRRPHQSVHEKLSKLASNYWWSWQPEVTTIFREIDPVRWSQLAHNPVALLRSITPDQARAALPRRSAPLAH